MATSVYQVVEIELIDGTKLTLRPLRISLLRDFMKKFQGLDNVDVASDNDKSMDLLIDCVQIAMQQYNPDLSTDRKKLEDVVDLPTVYKIIEIASGVKLNDPNLLAAAAALSGQI